MFGLSLGLVRFVGCAVGAQLLGLSVPCAASADVGTTGAQDESSIAQVVLTSPDPQAAYEALDANGQTLFKLAYSNMEPGDGYLVAPTPAPRSGAMRPGALDRVDTGPGGGGITRTCWSPYWYQKWTDFGVHTGDTWFQLHFCGEALEVVEENVQVVGGQGVGGNSYDGVIGQGSDYFGNASEFHIYREFKFHVGPAVANPCMQFQVRYDNVGQQRLKSCDLTSS